jgi:hypothetical protein
MKPVFGAAAAALVIATLSATPADAASNQYYAGIYHSHYVSPTSGCTYAATVDPTFEQSHADLPVRGGSKTLATTGRGTLKGQNGSAVSDVTTSVSSRVSFATAGGGIRSFTATEAASAAFSKAPTGLACGGTDSRLAMTYPNGAFSFELPATTSGWLDVTGTAPAANSAEGSFRYLIALRPPAAGAQVHAGGGDVIAGGTSTTHVYVPRGYAVVVNVQAEVYAYLEDPAIGRNRAAGSMTVRGTVTPAGSAATALAGPAKARRAVTLPAALACNGSARVTVAKTGKRTKAVALTVNGRVVKRIKKVRRATAYTVAVPRTGRVTLGAVVTPKKGAKATVSRSYVACH